MKLKYIIPSFIAVIAMLVGCSDKYEAAYLDDLRVSTSYVALAADGNTPGYVTINAASDWSFNSSSIPSWLTISPLSGSAGETKVTFSATATVSAQTAVVQLVSGSNVQEINIVQGKTVAEVATCKQVIDGADGKTFRVKGTITQIANTHYGNLYIADETGTVYIYGTNDKNGAKAADPIASWGLELGDVITVEGPKTTYNGTVELVDVTVLSVEKSLVKIIEPVTAPEIAKEGGELSVKLAFKGKGVMPTVPDDCNWIRYKSMNVWSGTVTAVEPNPADTAVVVFTVDPNEGGNRKANITFGSTNGSASSAITYEIKQAANVLPHGENPEDPYTVAEAIAKCVEIGNSSDGVIYYAKGIVSSISSIDTGSYGNATFKISDDGTDEKAITVFRSYFLNNEKFTSEDQIHVGDEVIITGKLVNYKGETPEFSGNVYVYSIKKGSNEPGTLKNPFTPAQANAFIATLEADKATEDDYYIKGKIIEITDKNQFNTTYGNCTFYISDDGTDKDDKFYVFRTYYLGNVKYTDDSWTKPQAGDEVIICGKLVNYKGNTPETSANKSYIYSLNGNR